MTPIKSPGHPSVKRLYSIRKERKIREEEGLCLLYSLQLLEEVALPIHELWVPMGTKIPDSLHPKKIIETTEEIIRKITGLKSASDTLGLVSLPKEKSQLKGKRLLLLDQVSDPGNLGTLIRTALAFGWEGIYLTDGCVDPFNDKAIRAGRGALFTLPYQKGNVEAFLDQYKDYSLLIADPKGDSIKEIKVEKPFFLALGNEVHGPSKRLQEKGRQIAVPMSDQMESLNVAIAGGILLYQMGMYG